MCNGACVNTGNDPLNCGGCGQACAATQQCNQGQCAPCQGQGHKVCDNACVNTRTDNNNCGDCGTVCDPNNPCQDGQCGG
jgi:hypothetical protein